MDWKVVVDGTSEWIDRQINRIPDQAFGAVAILCFVGVMAIVLFLLGDLAWDLTR